MKNDLESQGLSQAQVEMLLNAASQKLGIAPDKLLGQLKGGDLPQGLNMNMVKNILSDPQKLEALLNSEKAKKVLQSLMNRR
ncbi:MAG: hypothetical protein RR879_05725 [Hydrogenoanaerobacterium sp.]